MSQNDQHSKDHATTENSAMLLILSGTFIVFAVLFASAFYTANYFAAKIFTGEVILIIAAVILAKKLHRK